jgi:hypothetical protein
MFSANTSQVDAGAVNYIEDVFSTWLYTGNSPSTQSIVNGIDLSGKGGMVWVKSRVSGDGSTYNNILMDTARGTGSGNILYSNLTLAAQTAPNAGISSYNSNGFSLRYDDGYGTNYPSGGTFASWTFRKQPKFFDVVTYTGTGSATTIAHNLGSVPGCIIVKQTSASGNYWTVYHTSLGNTQRIFLNTTDPSETASSWNNTTPTSTVFSVGTSAAVNGSGSTYVAYLFAHNAGGFGLTGTDNVISCGSYTGNGSATGPVVTLGYEPQWIMIKDATDAGPNWAIFDNMRGIPTGSAEQRLYANTSGAEATTSGNDIDLTATGFAITTDLGYLNTSGSTFIYIAIRRGPMKVPTDATKVFGLSARSGTGANATVTGGQTDDTVLVKNRGSAVASLFSSRLTGTGYLVTSSTAAEVAAGTTILQANPWDVMDGVKVGTTSTITNDSASTYINYLFKRAPSVFDVVCYTGTGASLNNSHNLAVVPEMVIVKRRDATSTNGFAVRHKDVASSTLWLNTNEAVGGYGARITAVTASTFTVSGVADVNANGGTFIAYLFATCVGVSKVGSYTGNGTTQTIDCGITAGARFVLIKRTDAVGDWYVYDTARGMTTLTDPYWLTNSTAAEVATLGSVTTVSTGFALNSTILADINISAGSYIFLAIA